MAERIMRVIRGDDSDFELTFTDVDGEVIDLTGGTVFFTVKDNKGDTDAEAVITTEIDTFEAPETGICTLSLSSTETDITTGDYWYDIQLKDSLGRISSTYAGKFIVSKDITLRTDFS